MQAGFVWGRRIESVYRRSQRFQCLSTSHSVCHCLEPLSLGLSLREQGHGSIPLARAIPQATALSAEALARHQAEHDPERIR